MRMAKAMFVAIGIFLTVWAVLQLYFAIYEILSQHYKISKYIPVMAKVISSSLEEIPVYSGLRPVGHTFQPRIVYTYYVDGKEYKSNVVSIYRQRSGTTWSKKMINRFSEGSVISAYYNPREPADAYLLKEYIFRDRYGGVLIGMFLLGFSTILWFCIYHEFRIPRRPWEQFQGWFEIAPYSRIKIKFIASALVALLWHITALLTCGHYFLVAASPSKGSVISTIIYELIGLIPLILTVYYFLILSRVKEAQVFTNRNKFVLGDELRVKTRQPVHCLSGIMESTISLVCEQQIFTSEGRYRQYTKKKRCYEAATLIFKGPSHFHAEKLETEWSIIISEEQNPSTSFWEKIQVNRPRYSWYFEVNTKFRKRPHYRAKFPISMYKRENT